jgi:hypothetical protein
MLLASRGKYNGTAALCLKTSVEISMSLCIREEVSEAVNVHSVIVWVVTRRIVLNGLQYFKETDYLLLQARHMCSEHA